ncbi:MAG: hypothetical protein HDR24_09870 [Lachnospiraceae bacterium]|nr:hypothetical protein [Lachnospiraceae bacterium]
MIEDKRKIKELYNCEYIVSDEELYPLQKWYNKLIDKTINEITIADVLRMIRQKEFCHLAMAKAVEFLQDNVFAGETYDGELLENISEMNTSFLTIYSGELKSLLKDVLEKSEIHEWLYEREKEEFEDIVDSVLKKIK